MPRQADVERRIRERLDEQRDLVRSLLALRQQLQGSLFVRYGECGKAACACREGRKHGPYYVLSTRSAGRGGYDNLDPARAEEARKDVARYRAFRRGLKRLQAVNSALLTLLRRYQKAQVRQGSRRLAMGPSTRD